MSDDPVLTAVQKFMDAVEARLTKQETDIRSALNDLQTRAAQVGPGAPGKDGRDGKDGVPGKDGRDGVTGEKGDAGPVGKDGERGAQGERGADGLQGRDGIPGMTGERGADGVATREEMKAIWEESKADMNVRTFADIYQGVYENGKPYTRGLLTTWGGSLFLATEDTTDKPETSTAWKLIVKHGRDGRK